MESDKSNNTEVPTTPSPAILVGDDDEASDGTSKDEVKKPPEEKDRKTALLEARSKLKEASRSRININKKESKGASILNDDKKKQKKKKKISFGDDTMVDAPGPPPTPPGSAAPKASKGGKVPSNAGLQGGARPKARKESLGHTPLPADKRPDWYEDLQDTQIGMFKQVFELLDKDGGGSLDAEELYSVLKDLDINISLEEISSVLKELDKDGNGEIDFDEFLYAMSETDRYLDDETQQEGEYSKRQTLFFTAITSFAIKNSLGEIERYYATKMRQAPHVISCYTAGARLIGLNDRQLEQEIVRMQKAAKNQSSPYAQPLPFFTVRKKKKKKVAAKTRAAPVPPRGPPKPPPGFAAGSSEGKSIEGGSGSDSDMDNPPPQMMMQRRRTTVLDGDSDILKLLHDLAAKGSVIAKIPDIHLVPQIRQHVAEGKSGEPLCSSMRKRRRAAEQQMGGAEGGSTQGDKGAESRPATAPTTGSKYDDMSDSDGWCNPSGTKPRGWVIPRIERGQAPLPTVRLHQAGRKAFTIEDVPKIRVKVSEAMDKYYGALRKAHVQTAWEHWHRLHPEQIRSEKLRHAFRACYKAYSPHKENEVFAICPWIPGPRYTSKQPQNTTIEAASMISRASLRSSPNPSRPNSRTQLGCPTPLFSTQQLSRSSYSAPARGQHPFMARSKSSLQCS